MALLVFLIFSLLCIVLLFRKSHISLRTGRSLISLSCSVLSIFGCSTVSPGIPELYIVEIDIPEPPSTLRVGHYST